MTTQHARSTKLAKHRVSEDGTAFGGNEGTNLMLRLRRKTDPVGTNWEGD